MRQLGVFLFFFYAFLVTAQETAPAESKSQESAPAQSAAQQAVEQAPQQPQQGPGDDLAARVKALEEKSSSLENELAATRAALAEKEKTAQAPEKKEEKKDEKKIVDFTPYGYLELIGWAHDAQFIGSDLPIYVANEGFSTTGVTAKGTRLGLKIAFPSLEETVKLMGQLEVDFVANYTDSGAAESQPGIRMRHGFIDISKTWNNTTFGAKVGQTWATSTLLIFPNQINPAAGWGIGNPWQRLPLGELYLFQKFGDLKAGLQLGVARAMTGASANRKGLLETNIDAGDASHIPSLQGQLSLKGKISIIDINFGASGVWGREDYSGGVQINNKVDKDNAAVKVYGDTVDVWMFTTGLALTHEYAKIAGKFYLGENLDTYGVFGGALRYETDATGVKRVVDSQRVMGWWAELTLTPLPELAISTGYGSEDPEEKDNNDTNPLYFENNAIWVSAFYTLFSRYTIGLQYTRFQTEGIDIDPDPSKLTRGNLTGNAIMGHIKLTF